MTDRRNDYIIRKLFFSFVIVSVLSALTATVGMLIDNIIVGRFLGTAALGAMGIVGPVSLVFSAIGNVCSGGSTQAAQAMGKGDMERVQTIFTITVGFALAAGAVITCAGLLFTEQISSLLGAGGELFEPSAAYLRGYFLGTIPTILLTVLSAFVKLDGSPKLPLTGIIVMCGANIALDLMVVLVLDMGMFGMALATTVSYCLAVAVVCTHFIKKSSHLRLAPVRGAGQELLRVIFTGLPTALSRICDTLKITIFNHLIITFIGVGAVAAFSVRTQAKNFFGSLILGFAQACVPIAGMFFGEEDRGALRILLKTTLRTGILVCCAAGAAVFAIAPQFVGLLGVTDAGTVRMAVTAVRIFAAGLPFFFVNMALMSYYQSTGSTRMATVICVLQSFVYAVIFAVMLVRPLLDMGIWLALLLTDICTIVTVVLIQACRQKRVPLKIEDYMRLPKDFGGSEGDRLSISIGNSMDEVMEISKGIYKFGKNRAIETRTLDVLSLSIEEMAGNVVRHAFGPGEKRWLDLMILNKPDAIIARIRDNGSAFDPVAYVQTQQEGQEDAYGLKLILGIADRVEYRRTMDLNNVIISIKK